MILLALLWPALQRSRFILSSWKVILGSQAAPGISLGRMVLSTGPAHGHRCTGLASTAIDLSWQIARVVLRTRYRLVISFGMAYISIVCFCSSSAIETLDHLFFSYPLAQSVLSWLDRCSVLIPSIFSASSCAFWV